jgi:hypothetical protein
MVKFKLLDTFLQDGFYVTQNYGTNEFFDYTKYGLLYHEGVDFGHTNKTKEVRCVHGGECLTAYDSAYGRYVIVLNYELRCATWYCHLSKATIQNGQTVSAGDVIGNMGSTGNSTAPHCHFNFVLINANGTRIYQDKNQGYLDPLYPRDTGSPKKMGISYDIEWSSSIMADMYNGYDLANRDSMKSAVDFLNEWHVSGKLTKLLADKAQLEADLGEEERKIAQLRQEGEATIFKLKEEWEKKENALIGGYELLEESLEDLALIYGSDLTLLQEEVWKNEQSSTSQPQVITSPGETTYTCTTGCVKVESLTASELFRLLLKKVEKWFIESY